MLRQIAWCNNRLISLLTFEVCVFLFWRIVIYEFTDFWFGVTRCCFSSGRIVAFGEYSKSKLKLFREFQLYTFTCFNACLRKNGVHCQHFYSLYESTLIIVASNFLTPSCRFLGQIFSYSKHLWFIGIKRLNLEHFYSKICRDMSIQKFRWKNY